MCNENWQEKIRRQPGPLVFFFLTLAFLRVLTKNWILPLLSAANQEWAEEGSRRGSRMVKCWFS